MMLPPFYMAEVNQVRPEVSQNQDFPLTVQKNKEQLSFFP